MAGTFTSTGSYSNLTRLELEQLRRGDYTAGGKALTIGDSGLAPEGVVGPGSVNAEPFTSVPALTIGEVVPVTPPTQPGFRFGRDLKVAGGEGTGDLLWYGPTPLDIYDIDNNSDSNPDWITEIQIFDATTFQLIGTGSGSLDPGVGFTTTAVQAGDLLIILDRSTGSGGPTGPLVNTIYPIASVVDHEYATVTGDLSADVSSNYAFRIIRPNAVQLFAVPGSGPTGQEQTFMMVEPGSSLHSTVGPTVDAINADRVKNIIRPSFALDATIDRADALFPSPAPGGGIGDLGYRVILYPDDGTGTGPDLSSPITTLNPVIDPAIPSADQRMTIDYAAGIVRFSCAPAIGGDIKVSGGVNATTGRLNLYAVFLAYDTALTGGAPTFYPPSPVRNRSFTVTSDYRFYPVSTIGSGGVTATLPSAASMRGKEIIFKDVGAVVAGNPSGSFGTIALTIAPTGGAKIEGVTGNFIFEAGNGKLRMFSDGTNWWFV